MLYAFGTLMYFVAFRLVRWRRDRTEHDVANAFPEKSPSERAIIVRQSYRMLADTLMESFWGFGASAEAIKSRVAIENTALVTEYLSSGHSLVLLTAHYGNWEWLSLAAGATSGSRSMSSISRSASPRSTASCARRGDGSAADSFHERNSSST